MYCCLFGHEWDLPKPGFLKTVEVRERWWAQIFFVPPTFLQRIGKFFEFSLNSGNGTQIPAPAPRSTMSSKSVFSPRTVCQWVLCLILCTVYFGAVWLFSGAPASLFCVQQSCSWPWTRRLWTVMYTRSLSVHLMLFILNPGHGEPFSG